MDWRNFGIRAAVALVSLEFVLLVLQIGFSFRELPLDRSLAGFFYLPTPTDTARLTLLEVLIGVPALVSLLSPGLLGTFIAPVVMMYAIHLYQLPIGDAFPSTVGEFTMLVALATVVALTSAAPRLLGRWIR